MNKPILSPDFTMDDLYKLREYNSLRHKKMTLKELKADLKPAADEFHATIEKIRREKHLSVSP